MGNKYLKRINKFLSFFILISIVSFYVGFYPSSVYAQGTEVRRALPVGANVGDIAPRAIPVDDPTLIEASSVGLNLEIIGGSAISGCMAELLGGVLANSLSAGINTLLSAINLRVVVSNPALETKETGPSIGPIQLPSLDAIGFCLVNATIEAILAGTIEWVNGGFEGNPAFVDDPEQFFTDIADYELGNLLNSISGGFLCSPWDVNIRLAILEDYFGYRDGYRGCSLSEGLENIDQFIEGDFEQGGWAGWFSLTQKAENNPYESYINSRNRLQANIAARQGQITAELGWSGGFLSLKDPETGKTTTPGNLLQDSISRKLGLAQDRLTFADEFDELISALVNQFISIAFEELGGGGGGRF